MTIFTLGALRIAVHPFNVHAVSESGEAEFAVKPVVGREPPLEYVGAGGNEVQLSGRLFPAALGGLDELEILTQMRESGRPQYLMRGDGKPYGWHAILSHSADMSYLDAHGVGKQIDISIHLRRAQTPPAASFFSLVSRWI